MITKESLKQYVIDNPKLVTIRESTSMPGVFVLKYKKSVFYNDSWDDFLEHCRGSVVDKDFNLISYPFHKIYNYGIESRAPKLSDDTEVTAFRKVNGFMVSASFYNGDVIVSTTGSTDSDYVAMAKEMMLSHMCWADWKMAFADDELEGITVMFECVHPNDPHIISEKAGMYVLGYRENSWGSKVCHDPFMLQTLGDIFNCYVPESITTNMARLQELARECRHEGFVFYTADGQSAKIKSPYYLTSKWVARNPRTDKLVDLKNDIKKTIDEEYYNLIDQIRANIAEYTAMDEQSRLAWIRERLEVTQ